MSLSTIKNVLGPLCKLPDIFARF